MKLFKTEKVNRERGSATIEAIISFTGFLFVIFTILNMVNFCRAQMLVSNAVDTAVKEITQYSYFYKMSGLQDFSEAMANKAETGVNNLNDVVSTVDDLFTSLGTAVDDSVQNTTEIANAIGEGDLDVDSIETALTGLKADGTNIATSMNSIKSAFDGVKDNPLLYVKSLVAVAGNDALDFAKSRLIAAPLAECFTVKHFGKNRAEADKMLKGLGVVDGLDGLNFNMSSIFSSDAPDDVHIVVYYKLSLPQLFGWTTLEVPIMKESVARAWLGGDDVIVSIEPMVDLSGSDEDSTTADTEETPNEDQNTENKEEVQATPTPAPETNETEKQPVNTDGSYWHMYEEDYGYKSAAREAQFWKDFVAEHNIDESKPGYYSQPITPEGEPVNIVYFESSAISSEHYSFSAGFFMHHAQTAQKHIEAGYLPDTVKAIQYTLFVPENMPEEEIALLRERVSKGSLEYSFFYNGLTEEQKKEFGDIHVSVEIRPAGGNYDYESGWLDND